jgi:hypothetical protein
MAKNVRLLQGSRHVVMDLAFQASARQLYILSSIVLVAQS